MTRKSSFRPEDRAVKIEVKTEGLEEDGCSVWVWEEGGEIKINSVTFDGSWNAALDKALEYVTLHLSLLKDK